jgi:hypothetical protein
MVALIMPAANRQQQADGSFSASTHAAKHPTVVTVDGLIKQWQQSIAQLQIPTASHPLSTSAAAAGVRMRKTAKRTNALGAREARGCTAGARARKMLSKWIEAWNIAWSKAWAGGSASSDGRAGRASEGRSISMGADECGGWEQGRWDLSEDGAGQDGGGSSVRGEGYGVYAQRFREAVQRRRVRAFAASGGAVQGEEAAAAIQVYIERVSEQRVLLHVTHHAVVDLVVDWLSRSLSLSLSPTPPLPPSLSPSLPPSLSAVCVCVVSPCACVRACVCCL